MNDRVARLDAALARTGEDVILRRKVGTNQSVIDVKVRASVRPVDMKVVIGTMKETDSDVVISPTQIIDAQWPGGLSLNRPDKNQDSRVPNPATDFMVIAGRERVIAAVKPIYVDGELVRINMRVVG